MDSIHVVRFDQARDASVVELFTHTFSASEGEEEGGVIGELVQNLINTTPADDLVGYCALEDKLVVGALFFSRYSLPTDTVVFMMAPVAVSTRHQGKGIGQRLISDSLIEIKALGVELVLTYGDPRYYAKVGFKPISESIIPAPYPLSQPKGWLARSLTSDSIAPVQGEAQCVAAFRDPAYW